MSKTNSGADILAHLQSLDQCGYDLVHIIEKHFTKPAEVDKKELEERFWVLLIKMNRLVRDATKGLAVVPELPDKNLLAIGSGNQKYLEEALLPLNSFLSEVRFMRRSSRPSPVRTEIRDEGLRKYLEDVDKRKYDEIKKEKLATKIPEDTGNSLAMIVKGGKRVSLPRYPRTEWSKVSIRFLTEREVLLSDDKDVKPADFESLGFADTRKNPPTPTIAWSFLFKLACSNGISPQIPKREREQVKKYKQQIVDMLRRLFKNDTDPFEDFAETKTYRAKFQMIPPAESDEQEMR